MSMHYLVHAIEENGRNMSDLKRVTGRANKSSKNGYKAFPSIAYAIPKCTSAEDVSALFGVLECFGGQLPLDKTAKLLPGWKAITSYIPEHKLSNWPLCAARKLSLC